MGVWEKHSHDKSRAPNTSQVQHIRIFRYHSNGRMQATQRSLHHCGFFYYEEKKGEGTCPVATKFIPHWAELVGTQSSVCVMRVRRKKKTRLG